MMTENSPLPVRGETGRYKGGKSQVAVVATASLPKVPEMTKNSPPGVEGVNVTFEKDENGKEDEKSERERGIVSSEVVETTLAENRKGKRNNTGGDNKREVSSSVDDEKVGSVILEGVKSLEFSEAEEEYIMSLTKLPKEILLAETVLLLDQEIVRMSEEGSTLDTGFTGTNFFGAVRREEISKKWEYLKSLILALAMKPCSREVSTAAGAAQLESRGNLVVRPLRGCARWSTYLSINDRDWVKKSAFLTGQKLAESLGGQIGFDIWPNVYRLKGRDSEWQPTVVAFEKIQCEIYNLTFLRMYRQLSQPTGSNVE